jgi:hypothetical protein
MHSRFVSLAALIAVGAVGGCGSGHQAATPPAPAAQSRLAVVPELIGRHEDDAHRLAAHAGFGIRWTGFAGKLANGRYDVSCVKVLRQSPLAGERRPPGSLISIIEDACSVPKEFPHGVPHGR